MITKLYLTYLFVCLFIVKTGHHNRPRSADNHSSSHLYHKSQRHIENGRNHRQEGHTDNISIDSGNPRSEETTSYRKSNNKINGLCT